MLNPAPKNVRGGSQNHLKSYLRVPKTVTREKAYEGGQKLQKYINSDEVATLPVITANTVWKEFKTTLKARLKHVVTKDK